MMCLHILTIFRLTINIHCIMLLTITDTLLYINLLGTYYYYYLHLDIFQYKVFRRFYPFK